MRVAVTGAGGYLGRALVHRLLASGFKPFAIVKKESEAREYEGRGIDSVCRDLSKKGDYAGLLEGCKALVHCAALKRDYGRWEDFKRTNIDITRLVMECALDESLEKIIHISTTSVYGNDRSHYGTDEEADYGERVVDHYTRSKIEADKIVSSLIKNKNFPGVILRPGYIWGPGDQTIIPFIVKGLRSRRLMLVEDGENLLSLTFIDNVVEAIMRALKNKEATGRIFNITDGSKVTSKRFISDIMSVLGIELSLRAMPYPLIYSMAYSLEHFYRVMRKSTPPPYTRFAARFLRYTAIFDISRAIYDLGYQPKISYKAGMTLLTPYLRALYYGRK